MSTTIKRITIGLVLFIGIAILFSTLVLAQEQQQPPQPTPPQQQAQPQPPPPQRMSVENRVKILKDSLNLTDEQVTNITKILEDQREEMTTARNENRDNREAMQTARQEIMKKTDEKIKALLTEEQAKQYDEMLKARRARMGRRSQ